MRDCGSAEVTLLICNLQEKSVMFPFVRKDRGMWREGMINNLSTNYPKVTSREREGERWTNLMVGFKNCKTIDINQQLFILVSLYFVHVRRLAIFSSKKGKSFIIGWIRNLFMCWYFWIRMNNWSYRIHNIDK